MIELLNANALSIPLADGSVQMVATSPPYYGLRDYKTGQRNKITCSPYRHWFDKTEQLCYIIAVHLYLQTGER